jgi:hypothetical protein
MRYLKWGKSGESQCKKVSGRPTFLLVTPSPSPELGGSTTAERII